MKFGIFDHLEQRRGVPLAELYEERLKLIEQAERTGTDCWPTAEHRRLHKENASAFPPGNDVEVRVPSQHKAQRPVTPIAAR